MIVCLIFLVVWCCLQKKFIIIVIVVSVVLFLILIIALSIYFSWQVPLSPVSLLSSGSFCLSSDMNRLYQKQLLIVGLSLCCRVLHTCAHTSYTLCRVCIDCDLDLLRCVVAAQVYTFGVLSLSSAWARLAFSSILWQCINCLLLFVCLACHSCFAVLLARAELPDMSAYGCRLDTIIIIIGLLIDFHLNIQSERYTTNVYVCPPC